MTAVLHVIDTGGPGGAESMFVTLAAGLNQPGSSSITIVSREGWLADELRRHGLSPQILAARGGFNLGYLRALVAAIRKHRPTAVISHLYGASTYASLAGWLTGTPVVAVLHGPTDVARGGTLAAAKAWILRRGAARVVFVSEALRNELAPVLGLAASQCSVIPNGVDPGRFDGPPSGALRAELGLQTGTLLIGAIGNIRRPKGYDVFLRAARSVLDRGIRAHFIIAGDPQEPLYGELLALRDELGLASDVSFLGLRRDVPDLLRGLDLFVSSSTSEGFSLACVEAMAAGCPVVATRSGGPETIIEDGRTGVLVRPGNPQELADDIIRLAKDPKLRDRLACEGHTVARRDFSVQSTVGKYEILINGLCRKRT